MVINGREVGFTWNTGAYVDYNDWIVRNSSASVARAKVQRAVLMNTEYNRINKDPESKPLTVEEIRELPVYDFEALLAETDKIVERDGKRQIETAESKGKNAKSTAAKSN